MRIATRSKPVQRDTSSTQTPLSSAVATNTTNAPSCLGAGRRCLADVLECCYLLQLRLAERLAWPQTACLTDYHSSKSHHACRLRLAVTRFLQRISREQRNSEVVQQPEGLWLHPAR